MSLLDLRIMKSERYSVIMDLKVTFGDVKEWYDGYRFGNADVYCPWDVVNYCRDHVRNPNARVKNYWMNTSGNNVIDHLIDGMDQPGSLIKDELERLVNGDYVDRDVNEMITYKDLYANADNLWSTHFYDRVSYPAWKSRRQPLQACNS